MNPALAKKEFDDIIAERLYIFAFFAQLVIVMGILYAALLYTSVAAPETSTFVQTQSPRLGVIGEDADIATQLQEDLEIVQVSGAPLSLMRDLDLVGVLLIKSEREFELYLDNTNLLSGYAETVVDEVLSKRSAELKKEALEEKMETADIVLNPIKVKESMVGVQDASKRPPEFIVVMYGLLLPFILFLPTFLGMNMVTDSIVGEKERKTYEVLVAAPLTKREIILSKTVPILIVTLVQSFVWILLLVFKDIPIYNISLLMLLLLILDVIFIGIGVLISALSDTLKESNLTVTIMIILASIAMFAPVSLKAGVQRLNPITLITKLASNPQVPLRDLMP
ncbi:MAG: ABC transporter permease, partial [Candidatus Hydrothermarchaeales archaeon]